LLALGRPAVIIAIDGDMLAPARMLGTAWRVPYLYAMYEVWPNQFTDTPGAESRAMALLEACGVRGAAHILVMDPTWATLLARRYRVPRAKFSVVRICPPLPDRTSRPRITGPSRVYYHGGYTPGRGLEPLVMSMATVTNAELHLRGMGNLEPSLRALAQSDELRNKVFFHEPLPLEQLSIAAADFDVGVSIACPTTANGRFLFGFKTVENMAAGLAVASTDSYALTALVKRHDVGLTFKGCERESIARAFQFCADHPDRVAEWKRHARAVAETEFNEEMECRRLREIVAGVVAGHRRLWSNRVSGS
jgi:glycosyltransferase involved in cell wall biosynthesis